MNADFSFSFEPYKLREFYKPHETPQVVIAEGTVFCKHGHPNAEIIEEKIRSEGGILQVAKKIDSHTITSIFADVQVEVEFLQNLLEKNKDENAVFALSKLVRQEQSFLYLVTAIYNACVLVSANKILSAKVDSEKHARSPEKEKGDEGLSVFKSRTRLRLEQGDLFKIEIDSSSNPRKLRIFIVQTNVSKFSDYCSSYSACNAEIKTLESLQNSESFYAQLNCHSEEEREGVKLGIAISRKMLECLFAEYEKRKTYYLNRFAEPLNQTGVANQQSQVASQQLPGHTTTQIPPAQTGQQVQAKPAPAIPQPPQPKILSLAAAAPNGQEVPTKPAPATPQLSRPASPPKTLSQQTVQKEVQTDDLPPLARITNQQMKVNDLDARVRISQFIAHIKPKGLCSLPTIAKFIDDLQDLLNKELRLEENLKRIINSIPYDQAAEFEIQYFIENLFGPSKERVSNAPTAIRSTKRKANAFIQPKPQPVTDKKTSQTPEAQKTINGEDAAALLLAEFGAKKRKEKRQNSNT